jgi:hypothetical protein
MSLAASSTFLSALGMQKTISIQVYDFSTLSF